MYSFTVEYNVEFYNCTSYCVRVWELWPSAGLWWGLGAIQLMETDCSHSTLYNLQFTLHTLHCTENSLYYTMYTVKCTVNSVQCPAYSAQLAEYCPCPWNPTAAVFVSPHDARTQDTRYSSTLYSVRCTVYSVHFTLYPVNYTLDILHWTFYTVQCTYYKYSILHLRLYYSIRDTRQDTSVSQISRAQFSLKRSGQRFADINQFCFEPRFNSLLEGTALYTGRHLATAEGFDVFMLFCPF